jgi:uncharacterized protein YbaR (Trm112 family)
MRRKRVARRIDERAARRLVRDRERLAELSPGGASEHPIHVDSAAVIEVRTGALPCPQCSGAYRIVEHRSEGVGLRAVDVACRTCGAPRTLWFRLDSHDPN